jgi:hypothetical protein
MLTLIDGTEYSWLQSAAAWSGETGGCSTVVTLFFAKKPLTETDRCDGVLSWKWNQTLILNF